MFMHKQNGESYIQTTPHAINVGYSISFKNFIFDLANVYAGKDSSVMYHFYNGSGNLYVTTEIGGRIESTYTNHQSETFEKVCGIDYLNKHAQLVKFTVEQGMLCTVTSKTQYTYKDAVEVGTTLEYHARDGVKSLTVLMIGKDGALICENHKGETVTVRKNELSVAEHYDIIWQEVENASND